MADTQQQIDELRAALTARPDDIASRESLARALERSGQVSEAVNLLCEKLLNLSAHSPGALPCNCKRCIEPLAYRAETGGIKFVRDFSIAKGRVLFYWVPEEISRNRKLISRSISEQMRGRLGEIRKPKKVKA